MQIINKMCLSLGMEIKAQDLRIGSLIDYFGKIKTVIRISKENSCWYIGCSDKITDLMNCLNVEESYKGIPLTEEWLLKFGLQVSDDEYSVIFYTNEPKFWIRFENGIFTEFKYEVEIKYVHQLQNLYHSLVGEELTIK